MYLSRFVPGVARMCNDNIYLTDDRVAEPSCFHRAPGASRLSWGSIIQSGPELDPTSDHTATVIGIISPR